MSKLFENIIFGPVNSRRLGISLGVNLLPVDAKICSFNCIYCECGWTDSKIISNQNLPSIENVKKNLESKLLQLKAENIDLHNITFAGNGEPTLHPDFEEIINDTIYLRNKYFDKVEISVLSNSTTLDNKGVFDALMKIDNRILKLDAGSEKIYKLINLPLNSISLSAIVLNLSKFNSDLIIQSLFLRGELNNEHIDNTTDTEIDLWIEHLKIIKPKLVMLYPIDRATPAKNLEKISKNELEQIAKKVNAIGLKTQIYS